jgi:hypothetical protein
MSPRVWISNPFMAVPYSYLSSGPCDIQRRGPATQQLAPQRRPLPFFGLSLSSIAPVCLPPIDPVRAPGPGGGSMGRPGAQALAVDQRTAPQRDGQGEQEGAAQDAASRRPGVRTNSREGEASLASGEGVQEREQGPFGPRGLGCGCFTAKSGSNYPSPAAGPPQCIVLWAEEVVRW